jgi:ribosomal protein S12 methylthiotransferase
MIILVLSLILLGIVAWSVSSLIRRSSAASREKKAALEEQIAQEEARLAEKQEYIAQAAEIALGYDYDGAIELLTSIPDYESEPDLIDEIARNGKVVKYLDIPLQHINNEILRRMNRRGTGDEIRVLIRTLRERIPGLVLRTSLIAGLPGETEAEFEELCQWLREVRMERVGVFPFSPEEGTPAAKMTDRCDEEEAQRRAELLVDVQSRIMDDYNESKLGETVEVLCEGFDEESGLNLGRSYADSPDIDGQVLFSGPAREGELQKIYIERTEDGLLYGRVKEEEL